MNNKKSRITNILIFIILTIITYFIIFSKKDMKNIFVAIQDVNILYILLGIICMFMYFLMEAINIKSILKNFKYNINIFKALKFTLIGFFFSSITPSSTGGQPAEIYYMSKEKISASASALALLIEVSSFLFCTISMSTIAFIINPTIIPDHLVYLFILGTLVSLIVISIYFICKKKKKITHKLVNSLIKLLKIFKAKNIENIQIKIERELTKYHDSADYIKKHKKEFLFSFIRVFIQVIFFYLVPYCIYKSFGYTQINVLKFISMQAVLYTTVSFIPLPGSVGINESVFLHIYSVAYPKELIGTSLLLTRGINFYFFVIISAIISTTSSFKRKS